MLTLNCTSETPVLAVSPMGRPTGLAQAPITADVRIPATWDRPVDLRRALLSGGTTH